MTTDAIGERTEVLHGEQNVLRNELEFFSNSKEKIDTCMNYTRPTLAITIEPIRGAFVDAKKKGIKLRYLTEVTKDNISYCKELIPLVHEMRHLDGIKGNFMLSETEYLAPLVLFEKGKIASKIIYSNEKELVDQHQYMFDTLWNKAISAKQKIKEIEEGIIQEEHYQTRLLENPHEVSEEIRKTINRDDDDEWSICSTFDGLLMMTSNKDFEMQERLVDSNKKGKNTRWIGTINKDNIHLVKAYLDLGMKIKHIKNMPPMNFAVSSKELYTTIDEMKGGKIAKNLLVSNEPLYVNHFNSLFEELWKDGIEATERIKDIEAGVDLADVEVISSSAIAQDRYLDIVKSASEEILWIFPTSNAFLRQDKMSAIPLAIQATRERNVKVKILVPTNKVVEQRVQQLKQNCQSCPIDVRYIEQMSETRATILVVDRKDSMVMELKDDSKSTFYEAIGLSTYSNSRAGVLSYVAIFENLWKQSELYDQLTKAHEQLKIHDKIQKEFINIAAHELRSPIQPILSLSEVVLNNTKDIEQAKLLEVINRNGKRLQQLTENILDVTKMESNSLQLNKKQFNLREMILNAMSDCKSQLKEYDSIRLEFFSKGADDIFVQADKTRLDQIISNLLYNAIKFTREQKGQGGIISVTLEVHKNDDDNNNREVIVSIKDTGIGIAPEIMPRLFTKFATKSEIGGTGLGLFISKSIIEAHGGKIWAQNNSDGKGATFSFSLPIVNK